MEQVGRFEYKYTFPNRHADAVLTWLDHLCVPDPQYADNVIHSLYFDSCFLEAAEEKWQSTFFKAKVRLRWYTDVHGLLLGTTAQLEVKDKVGRNSQKYRCAVEVDPARLVADPVGVGESLDVASLLPSRDRAVTRRILPVCVIRYRRRRYIDPRQGARVALDSGIGVTHSNPLFRFPGLPTRLRWGVLEMKGSGRLSELALPPDISVVRLSRTAFSKYGECVRCLQSGGYH